MYFLNIIQMQMVKCVVRTATNCTVLQSQLKFKHYYDTSHFVHTVL